MAKINWAKALQDYIVDESMSYAKIAEKYGVSTTAVEVKGKEESWAQIREETLAKVRQVLPEKVGTTIAEINARHVNIARMLQTEGVVAITKEDRHPRSFRDAREAISDGIAIERKAMGMEEKGNVNISIGYQPPSWYMEAEEVENGSSQAAQTDSR